MDLQSGVRAVAETQGGLAPRAALVAAGLDVRRLGGCPGVHRAMRGVWASAPLPPWPRFVVRDTGVDRAYAVRVLAVLLALGPKATARGRTAAALRGWGLLVEPRVVEVSVPHGRRPRLEAWITVRQARGPVARQPWHPSRVAVAATAAVAAVGIGTGSAPEQVREAGLGDVAERGEEHRSQLWTATPLQAALDCLVELPALQAVVAVDSALRAGDVTVEALVEAVADLGGTRGAARARRALALCDPQSGSVLESVLRFRLVEAGLTAFRTQRVVDARDGRRLLRVDLCFEAARLVVEADGSRFHPDPGLDRWKDNELAAAGWRVIRLTWGEVVGQPQRVVALVRAALLATQPSVTVALAA